MLPQTASAGPAFPPVAPLLSSRLAQPDNEDGVEKTEEPRRLVMALVGRTGLRARGVETALAGHFADLAIDVDVVQLERRSAGQLLAWARARSAVDELAIVMWFETYTSLADESVRVGRLHLRWSDEDGRPRVYVRELKPEPGAQISVEVLAVTVRSLSQAIASGELEGDPVEAESDGSAKAAVAENSKPTEGLEAAGSTVPQPKSRLIDLEFGYLGGSLAPEIQWQHGFLAGMSVLFDGRFGVGMQVGHQWAPDSEAQPVQLAIRRLPVSLRFAYVWRLPLWKPDPRRSANARRVRMGRHLEVAAGLRGTMEWFSWQAIDPGPQVLRESSGGRWRAALAADVAGKWQFLGPVGLKLGASMEVWMANLEVSAVVGEGETAGMTEIPLVFPNWLSVTVFGGFFVRL